MNEKTLSVKDLNQEIVAELDFIKIADVETLTYPEAENMFDQLFAWLKPGTQIEFPVPDFTCIFELYQRDRYASAVFNKLVFTPGRQSVWDEMGIVQTLLTRGYYRVWTGRVEGYPDTHICVRAVKLKRV